MTPLRLKKLLVSHKTISLEDISRIFDISRSMALELVDFWVRRGCCVEVQACDSCQLCDRKSYYQWKVCEKLS